MQVCLFVFLAGDRRWGSRLLSHLSSSVVLESSGASETANAVLRTGNLCDSRPRTIESDERLSPRTFRRFSGCSWPLSLRSSAAAAHAEQVEDLPKPTDYVSDYAHVLSAEAVARLDGLCAQLDHSRPMHRLP